MADTQAGTDLGLLPRDRSFAQSLPAFIFPYVAYVGLASLPQRLLPPEAADGLRFAVVAVLLWSFRRNYRFGPPLRPGQIAIACAAAPVALALWILTYRLSLALPWWQPRLASAAAARPSDLYFVFRAFNSVLLVPIFEELFCRAWLGELLFGMPAGPGGFSARLGRRMDDHPVALAVPPLSRLSAWGCALLFTIGHNVSAWLPALIYFGVTNWIYRRARSFRVCVVIHGLVNLGIAGLVRAFPDLAFLWF